MGAGAVTGEVTGVVTAGVSGASSPPPVWIEAASTAASSASQYSPSGFGTIVTASTATAAVAAAPVPKVAGSGMRFARRIGCSTRRYDTCATTSVVASCSGTRTGRSSPVRCSSMITKIGQWYRYTP